MSSASSPDRPVPRRQRLSSHWAVFGAAVLGLLAVSLWLRASVPARSQPAPIAVRPNSMAILPFINASPDSADDYLGPGVAAELTRSLTRLAGLRVAARSSAFACHATAVHM